MLDLIIGFLIFFSSILTIAAANSIYGALQLIVTYCLVSILLLIYDIEFFAITYIIVCAGGMGVLFLFVVMTLSIIQLPQKLQYYSRWSILKSVGQFFVFIVPMIIFLWTQFFLFTEFDLTYLRDSRLSNYTYSEIYGTNIMEIGSFLYLQFPLIVILGGIILFFALIAAVFLTVEHSKAPRWNEFLFKFMG